MSRSDNNTTQAAGAGFGAIRTPEPDSWIFGDIAVDENGSSHTYRYAMLISFKSLEDFRAAKSVLDRIVFSSGELDHREVRPSLPNSERSL